MMPQDASKTPQGAPRGIQNAMSVVSWAQHGNQNYRNSCRCPRTPPEDGPRRPHHAPRRLQDGSRSPKKHPKRDVGGFLDLKWKSKIYKFLQDFQYFRFRGVGFPKNSDLTKANVFGSYTAAQNESPMQRNAPKRRHDAPGRLQDAPGSLKRRPKRNIGGVLDP